MYTLTNPVKPKIVCQLEVERAKNLAGSRRDEPKLNLELTRRAETSFFWLPNRRDEPRRALAWAKRAKNEPNFCFELMGWRARRAGRKGVTTKKLALLQMYRANVSNTCLQWPKSNQQSFLTTVWMLVFFSMYTLAILIKGFFLQNINFCINFEILSKKRASFSVKSIRYLQSGWKSFFREINLLHQFFKLKNIHILFFREINEVQFSKSTIFKNYFNLTKTLWNWFANWYQFGGKYMFLHSLNQFHVKIHISASLLLKLIWRKNADL